MKASLSAFVFFFALCACAKTGKGRIAVESNQKKWNRSKPEKFQYTFERLCLCPPDFTGPFQVKANRDSVLTVARLSTDSGSLPVEEAIQSYSIDTLMTRLSSDLKRKFAKANLRFHKTYGFPELAELDEWKDTIDDEITFKIYGFEAR